MFSSQNQVRISPDLPPRDRLEPILPGIRTNNKIVRSSEFEAKPTKVGENVVERQQETQVTPHLFGFPVPKLELHLFEGQKP